MRQVLELVRHAVEGQEMGRRAYSEQAHVGRRHTPARTSDETALLEWF